MTLIRKKRLSNISLALVAGSISFLIVFFSFSLKVDIHFLRLLSAGLTVTVFCLLGMRWQLAQKKSAAELYRQDYKERANVLQAEIANERFVLEAWQEKISNYSQLKDLTEKLSLCLSLTDTSRVLSSETHKFFGKKDITTIIYIFHSQTGELGISSSQKGEMTINIKSKKGDIFDEWVIKAMQPLLVEDVKNDFRFDIDKIRSEETREVQSLISIPLIVGTRTLGILRIDSPRSNHFTTEDLRVLKTIGDLGAVAIENAQLYERVEELAIRDGLTGLYLRRYLLVRLTEEVSRQLRRKKPLSFLMIDLDHFKKYNDHYGHTAGDIVLKMLATMLSDHFSGPGNLVCRYGGEEFAILLPDCSKHQAVKSAEEIRKKIEKQEIILRKEKTRITISVGVATLPTDSRIKEELINAADMAMYEAKHQGRNRVCTISK